MKTLFILSMLSAFTTIALSGDLNPTGPPGPTMKPLHEIEPRRPIFGEDLPLTITQSGSYYFAGNINYSQVNTNAITIDAGNVTIDLSGYALIGPGKTSGSSGNGITTAPIRPVSNVTICNGSVENFSGSGIYLGGFYNQISRLRVVSVGEDGIFCGSNSTVESCVVSLASDDGIEVDSGSVVIACSANGSTDAGILVTSSVVRDCASTNCNVGISGDTSTILGCVCHNNGIAIGGSQCVIQACQCRDSSADGIYLVDSCHVRGNNIYGSSGYGLHIIGTSNYVIQNSVVGSGLGSFIDEGSDNYMPQVGDNANFD